VNFDYVETIVALNPQQRIYFYELFGRFLTVSMQGGLFFGFEVMMKRGIIN